MTHGKAVYYDRYFTLKLLTTEEDNMSMKLELYGTHPVFIFNPHDTSNRPVKGIHDNPIRIWKQLSI